ncbi:DUF309 domain-containing protein [Streptomyces catenulae]|uniref:DUF309 domain-containing protein n=1 Tax=Streptomyces catenulae TaxID=66875 RepID=A0ABV2Z830_9ACTN|nr:DUF309 domain-containing protein [Streptomyces catenulae]
MSDAQRDTGRTTSDTPRPATGGGGDPACWLDRVCEVCGRIDDRPDGARDGCRFCAEEAAPPAAEAAPPVAARRRDRDADGRARNARPRDGLGRPLPYGTPGVARQPEGVVRTPEATLTEAQRLLDAGMPFHAHEVLEDAWKTAAEPERALWRGLAQLAVGLTHAARANATGAVALLDRGAAALAPYADTAPYGIDTAALTAWARRLTARLRDAPAKPVPAAGTAPRLRG